MITAENVPAFEARATDRLILFSDAVVAIAITLLALELPVPAGRDVHEFWRSARDNDRHYLAFLISFFVIAACWGQHHRVFRNVERVDRRLRTVNTTWLLMIILNPFATKLLVTKTHISLATHALQWGFYALLQVLANVALLVMTRRLASLNPAAEDTTAPATSLGGEELYGVIIGFGLSIPVFFATPYAWVLWIAVPAVAKWVRLPLRRGERGPQNA